MSDLDELPEQLAKDQSTAQALQAQLDAIWPNGQPVTLAMLQLDVTLDGFDDKLTIECELRAMPDSSQEYRARCRWASEPWQEWQQAEPAIGAQALLDL